MSILADIVASILKHRRMSARRRGIEAAARRESWGKFVATTVEQLTTIRQILRLERAEERAREEHEARERAKPRVVRSPA